MARATQNLKRKTAPVESPTSTPKHNHCNRNKRVKRTLAHTHSSPASEYPAQHQFLAPSSVSSIESWLHNLPVGRVSVPNMTTMRPRRSSHIDNVVNKDPDELVGSEKRKRVPSRKALETLAANLVQAATPPQSTADLSSAGERTTSRTKSTIDTGRARGSLYRAELLRHHIQIDVFGKYAPGEVRSCATEVLQRSRQSPGPTDEDVERLWNDVEEIVDLPESSIQDELLHSFLFPQMGDYSTNGQQRRIKQLIDILLKSAVVPSSPVETAPLPTPKPDVLYGYGFAALWVPSTTARQNFRELLHNHNLYNFAQPTAHELIWPFLTIEFKANNTGSEWVAENQNAGAGACCVRGVDVLIRTASPSGQRRLSDSMAFSCFINATRATLWIHCVTTDASGVEQYWSSKVGDYRFEMSDEAIAFRRSLRNIMDWALCERLNIIKRALSQLRSIGEKDIVEVGREIHEGSTAIQTLDNPDTAQRSVTATTAQLVTESEVIRSPWTQRMERFLQKCVAAII